MPIKPLGDIERRHTPTVAKHRFGNTPELQKLTTESARLAMLADDAQRKARSVVAHTKRLRADPTKAEAQRLLAEWTFARDALAAMDGQYVRLVEEGQARLESLTDELQRATAPSSNAGQAAIDSEIRARIAKMKDVDALRAIESDQAILRAVVSAPRLLSGMSQERWERLWGDYVRQVEPQLSARFSDLSEAVKSAKTAMASLYEDTHELIDFQRAELVQKSKVEA